RAAQVDAGRHNLGLGDPARRVVGADDLGVGAAGVSELLRGLAADVRAEEVVDGLRPGRAQDRELQRLRDEREAEVEVEDVRAGGKTGERAPLDGLAAHEPAWPVE